MLRPRHRLPNPRLRRGRGTCQSPAPSSSRGSSVGSGEGPAPEPPARATAAKGGRKTGNSGHGWGKAKGTYAPPPARAPQSPSLLSVPSRKTGGCEGIPTTAASRSEPSSCTRCHPLVLPVMPQPGSTGCPGCPLPENSGTAAPATHTRGRSHRQLGMVAATQTGGQSSDTAPAPGLGPV